VALEIPGTNRWLLMACKGSETKETREEESRAICSQFSTSVLVKYLHLAIKIFNC
jgi:hypothetical protein